jgi:hypothetical protein
MILQLAAIWTIVLVTIVWFVRDERRLLRQTRLNQVARYLAEAPQYRHVHVESDPVLKAARRSFLRHISQPASPEGA